MQLKFNKKKYFQSTELDVVSGLKQGDVIVHMKKFCNTYDQSFFFQHIKYVVQYDPVFFSESKNWAVRVTSRSLNGSTVYNDTLYINRLTIYRYYFPVHISHRRQCDKSQEQMQSLLQSLDEQIDIIV